MDLVIHSKLRLIVQMNAFLYGTECLPGDINKHRKQTTIIPEINIST